MLNNLRNQLPIPDPTPKLLRHRGLSEIPFLLQRRQININTRTLARENLSVQTRLAEVDTRSIHLIQ